MSEFICEMTDTSESPLCPKMTLLAPTRSLPTLEYALSAHASAIYRWFLLSIHVAFWIGSF